MSVEMTNSGSLGWISDRRGYRYSSIDPVTRHKWPEIGAYLQTLAIESAAMAGYEDFSPTTCLINKYSVGTKLGLHVDKDEGDTTQPIVAFCLGLSARFLWGGLDKNDEVQSIILENSDTIVWGGRDRLRYHGVEKVLNLAPEDKGDIGKFRYTLTFRHARARQL